MKTYLLYFGRALLASSPDLQDMFANIREQACDGDYMIVLAVFQRDRAPIDGHLIFRGTKKDAEEARCK